MQQVAFCDCACLNALLTVRDTARRTGRRLRITVASRLVERLFELTDTTPFLACPPARRKQVTP
ncbi:anti-sigma factor antagonist [Streptomyces sp. A1547]|nr:anti-sigma factor antagonist [Streptomyces sp. A1547]